MESIHGWPRSSEGCNHDRMFRRLIKVFVAVNIVVGLAGLAARLLLTGRGGPESDEIDLVTVFEGLHLRSNSSAFMGGSTLAPFGGIVLDLRRANLGPTGATLEVTTLRSEEHTSELQSRENLVCRLLLEKKKQNAL